MADWKNSLRSALDETRQTQHEKESTQMTRFLDDVVMPAFAELRDELEEHGREVVLRRADTTATLIVHYGGEEEITYRIQSRTFPNSIVPFADIRYRERKGLKFVRAESMFRSGKPDYSIEDVTRDEVIQNFLKQYLPRVQRD
mgnify:CR=1 FL=1